MLHPMASLFDSTSWVLKLQKEFMAGCNDTYPLATTRSYRDPSTGQS